jgi:hypothetical protein
LPRRDESAVAFHFSEFGGAAAGAFGFSFGTASSARFFGSGFAGVSADLHEVLVPLVGLPPKAQGMSSWKKWGMSVLTVFRMSSKKSARAGAGANAVKANVPMNKPKTLSDVILVNAISPDLLIRDEPSAHPARTALRIIRMTPAQGPGRDSAAARPSRIPFALGRYARVMRGMFSPARLLARNRNSR